MNRWTTDEVRLLTEGHAAGLRAHIVAHRVGRTVTAIREKARLLGLHWGRARRLPPVGGSQGATAGTLADEIAQAKREAPSAPLYRPGDRL